MAQIDEYQPATGRHITDDGQVFNIADAVRASHESIARGLYPGAEPFMAFGERVADAGETRQAVLPVGDAVNIAAAGAGLTLESTSADDAGGGVGIQVLRIHYLRQDLTEQTKTVTLNGTTPVSIGDSEFRFMQCMHAEEWGSSGPEAAGDISARDSGGDVYSLTKAGEVRCTSSYRMVPAGKRLFVDSAVTSSISGTSETRSQMQFVASQIFGRQYLDPLGFFPFLAVGVQDNGVPLNFPPRGPFLAGTVVGALYTSGKAATVTASWYGRVEPTG